MLGFLVAAWLNVQDAPQGDGSDVDTTHALTADVCALPPVVLEAGFLIARESQRAVLLNPGAIVKGDFEPGDSIALDTPGSSINPKGLSKLRCTASAIVDGHEKTTAEWTIWAFPKGAVLVHDAKLN